MSFFILAILCSIALLTVQSCGRSLDSSGGLFSLNNNDSDFDGVSNYSDNCPDIYNPNQVDLNNDGLGDACSYADELTAPNLSIVEDQSSVQSMMLSWTQHNYNIISYKLKRKINDTNYVVLAELDPQTHSYKDINLIPGQSYTYRLEAYDGTNTRVSNEVSFDIATDGSLVLSPDMPEHVYVDFVRVNDDCYPRFNWYDNSDDETFFILFGSILTWTDVASFNDDILYQYNSSAQETQSTGWRSYVFIGELPLLNQYDNSILLEISACNTDGCSDFSPQLYMQNAYCQ